MLTQAVAAAAIGAGALPMSAAATPLVIRDPAAGAPSMSLPASPPSPTPLLDRLTRVSTIGSTVPPDGDLNPYGIARVASSTGRLRAGDLLVSNFNDRANRQGTGTTIVEISPSGKHSTFARIRPARLPGPCPGGVGLTTALDVLPGGDVIVGSLPTTDGTAATARAGCLIVLNSSGRPIGTIAGPKIQGPWDSTLVSRGSTATLFVSMALVGGAAAGTHTVDDSTVVRIRLRARGGRVPEVLRETVIADRIPRRDDPAALVIGPTGLALGPGGRLDVADTLENRISVIPAAMTRTSPAPDGGTTLSSGGSLNGPLGLTRAPHGDVIAANAGDGDLVEIDPAGRQVATRAVDTTTGAGSLFGLITAPSGRRIDFVDDGDNTLKVLH